MQIKLNSILSSDQRKKICIAKPKPNISRRADNGVFILLDNQKLLGMPQQHNVKSMESVQLQPV